MRKALRIVRDSKLVLPLLVALLRAGKGLGLVPSRRLYSHVPYRGVVAVSCGGNRGFLIESRGHNIENGLFWEGLFGHEPETMRIWIDLARHAGVVLDIGANSGVFALSAAAVGASEVHAFEPLERVHGILRGNFELNRGLPLNAWRLAVGDRRGKATLYDPGGDAPTSASLSQDFASIHLEKVTGQDVDVETIDSFVRERSIPRVDLLKIDVEGFEESALRGMRETVGSSRPAIVIEVLEGRERVLRQTVEDLWPGVFDWIPIVEGGGRVSRNVLLSPKEREVES